ncbi:unnamed protein product [Dicrocoelium dendriticum]|nr:unnamed protein product [Dicrocoelium dendriticum]
MLDSSSQIVNLQHSSVPAFHLKLLPNSGSGVKLYGLKARCRTVAFLDASGKLPPGITGGDLTWVGSYELCNSIHVEQNGSVVNGRYCNIRIPVSIRDPDIVIPIGISFGICLPSGCDTPELLKIASTALQLAGVKLDVDYSFCHSHKEEQKTDGYFKLAILITVIVTGLVMAGSVLEIALYWKWNSAPSYQLLEDRENSELERGLVTDEGSEIRSTSCSELSRDRNDQQIGYKSSYEIYRESFALKYYFYGGSLVAFSLPWNLRKLWCATGPTHVDQNGQVKQHPLSALNGIRAITLTWIVGLLSCYVLMPEYKKAKTTCRKLFFWLDYSLHRFIRIAPSWFFVTILFIGLFPYLTDGPLYPQHPRANTELVVCRDHWWITFLNNWLKMDKPCMLWTWYLSNDYQFSVILTPIFIILLAVHWMLGILFAVGLVISAAIASFVLTYKYEYGPSPVPPVAFSHLYGVPYTRWGSYALGMITAWLMLERPINVKNWSILKRCLVSLSASLIAAVFNLSTLFGLVNYFAGDPPSMRNSAAALYAALSRPVWTLGISIAIYQCAFQLTPVVNAILCFRGFVIPAKLTYCAYLIHPVVIMYFQLSSKRTQSYDYSYLFSSFAATWTISYLMAIAISMCTEVPMLQLDTLLRRKIKASRVGTTQT